MTAAARVVGFSPGTGQHKCTNKGKIHCFQATATSLHERMLICFLVGVKKKKKKKKKNTALGCHISIQKAVHTTDIIKGLKKYHY